jgi:hypothetical protein
MVFVVFDRTFAIKILKFIAHQKAAPLSPPKIQLVSHGDALLQQKIRRYCSFLFEKPFSISTLHGKLMISQPKRNLETMTNNTKSCKEPLINNNDNNNDDEHNNL